MKRRAAPSSNKKTHLQSDFKRIKAKVGRRAPKQLNATDTAFHSATVQVPTQSIGTTTLGHDVVSSRNKTLHQLVSQLSHPAPAVRVSALQGIRDAATRASPPALKAHLSVLLPALSKCLVDEDDAVRCIALTIWKDVVAGCLDDNELMRPFLPLSLAYATSALNSLNDDIQLHGCRSVELLCTKFGPIVTRKQVYSMLPPYTRLLENNASRGVSGSGGGILATAKRNEKAKNGTAKPDNFSVRGIGVLRSLIAVLKSSSLGRDCGMTLQTKENLPASEDLTFLPGGHTSNALLILSKSFPSRPNLPHQTTTNASERIDVDCLSIALRTELLSKLRDWLVEVTQRGHTYGSNALFFSSSHLEELSLLLTSIRLLWKRLCQPLLLTHLSEVKKLYEVGCGVQGLLLESFPVRDDSGNVANIQQYEAINALMCSALGELGSALTNASSNIGTVKGGEGWVEAVFAYLFPRLRTEKQEMDTSSDRNSTIVVLLKVIGQLLLPQTSRVGADDSYLLIDLGKRLKLLTAFGEAFFPVDGEKAVSFVLCQSVAGQRSAILLTSLIAQHLQAKRDDNSNDWNKVWRTLVKMCFVLPRYLQAWAEHYPDETSVVLGTLLSIVRRCDYSKHDTALVSEPADDDTSDKDALALWLGNSLRSSLAPLFMGVKRRSNSKKTAFVFSSIFENLPVSTQRLAIGLVGSLQYPTETILVSLAQICARTSAFGVVDGSDESESNNEYTVVSDAMADYIMEVVHCMRRTTSMQAYLSFLVNSIGIEICLQRLNDNELMKPNSPVMIKIDGNAKVCEAMDKNPPQVNDSVAAVENSSLSKSLKALPDSFDGTFIFSHDIAVARSCHYLVRCGGMKVLLMLSPVILSWLDKTCITSTLDMTRNNELMSVHIMRARAALGVLACFALTETTEPSGLQLLTTRSIFDYIPAMEEPVIHTMCDLIQSTSLDRSATSDDVAKQQLLRLLAPSKALMVCQPSVVTSILKEINTRVSINAEWCSIEMKECIILNLLLLLETKSLINVFRTDQVSKVLTELSNSVQRALAHGRLDRLGGRLKTAVQALIGFSK